MISRQYVTHLLLLITFLCGISLDSPAADANAADSISGSNHKGKFYFYWGYNGSVFTQSNIHFGGPDYDFTVLDAVAHDRPSPFSFALYFNPGSISIPQYNYRIGYYLADRFSISIGLDHMKYVMDQNQTALITGTIDDAVGGIYADTYNKSPMVLTEDFLRFEHTDGLNLLSADAEYTLPLLDMLHQKMNISFASGLGIAAMIPRTDVHVIGDGINNKFHLAGYGLSVKTGVRIEFFQNFFMLVQLRSGFINLPDILLNDNVPQRADQHFIFLEYFFTAGMTFPFHRHL